MRYRPLNVAEDLAKRELRQVNFGRLQQRPRLAGGSAGMPDASQQMTPAGFREAVRGAGMMSRNGSNRWSETLRPFDCPEHSAMRRMPMGARSALYGGESGPNAFR